MVLVRDNGKRTAAAGAVQKVNGFNANCYFFNRISQFTRFLLGEIRRPVIARLFNGSAKINGGCGEGGGKENRYIIRTTKLYVCLFVCMAQRDAKTAHPL